MARIHVRPWSVGVRIELLSGWGLRHGIDYTRLIVSR